MKNDEKMLTMKEKVWYRFSFELLSKARHAKIQRYDILVFNSFGKVYVAHIDNGEIYFNTEEDRMQFSLYFGSIKDLTIKYERGLLTSEELRKKRQKRYPMYISIIRRS